MKEVNDNFGNWFAGFTDGEGCFSIGKQNRNNPYACYNCQFQIALRDDDKAILEEIQDTLGIGAIYTGAAYFSGSHNIQTQSIFHISAIAECAELVEVFSRYPLRAKRQRDFEIWKLAVAELQKPCNHRDPDLLEYYFQKIKQVRQYEAQEELIKPSIKKLQLTIEFKSL